jgi:phage terminase small subunit
MAKQSKQDLFVEEYLIDLNATQAAIRAGYSVKTANEQGARLLANVSVQTKIAKAMAERSKRTGVNQDRVVLELAKMAFVNPSELIDTNTGKVLPGASPDDLACIQSVKVKKTVKGKSVIEEREVRVHDKLKALEKLGQHLGMWNDKIDVNVAVPVVICGEDDLED